MMFGHHQSILCRQSIQQTEGFLYVPMSIGRIQEHHLKLVERLLLPMPHEPVQHPADGSPHHQGALLHPTDLDIDRNESNRFRRVINKNGLGSSSTEGFQA